MEPVPIPNAYWVKPGLLLAGPYPDMCADPEGMNALERLLAAGIRCFVDLTAAGDARPYARRLPPSVGYLHLPIPDFGTPAPVEMMEILDALDHAIQTQPPVYVHCLAGLGRTGMVVGCYLARHGISGTRALARLQRLRRHTPKACFPSPETPAQTALVREWRVGE